MPETPEQAFIRRSDEAARIYLLEVGHTQPTLDAMTPGERVELAADLFLLELAGDSAFTD